MYFMAELLPYRGDKGKREQQFLKIVEILMIYMDIGDHNKKEEKEKNH